jgi:hypothetical protein
MWFWIIAAIVVGIVAWRLIETQHEQFMVLNNRRLKSELAPDQIARITTDAIKRMDALLDEVIEKDRQ